MKLALALSAVIALSACESGPSGPGVVTPAPMGWQVFNTNNVYTGAGTPMQLVDNQLVLDIPQPPGNINYVTMASGSLADKSTITMRFRLEGEGHMVATDVPTLPGMVTLYFQQANLCWSAQCEAMRWFSTTARVRPPVAGEYQLQANLNSPDWTAVLTSTPATNPAGYAAARANAGRVGFVMGGGNGVGHGVHAVGPVRMVVTSFTVQ
jgi:hypothetical protein